MALTPKNQRWFLAFSQKVKLEKHGNRLLASHFHRKIYICHKSSFYCHCTGESFSSCPLQWIFGSKNDQNVAELLQALLLTKSMIPRKFYSFVGAAVRVQKSVGLLTKSPLWVSTDALSTIAPHWTLFFWVPTWVFFYAPRGGLWLWWGESTCCILQKIGRVWFVESKKRDPPTSSLFYKGM